MLLLLSPRRRGKPSETLEVEEEGKVPSVTSSASSVSVTHSGEGLGVPQSPPGTTEVTRSYVPCKDRRHPATGLPVNAPLVLPSRTPVPIWSHGSSLSVVRVFPVASGPSRRSGPRPSLVRPGWEPTFLLHFRRL